MKIDFNIEIDEESLRSLAEKSIEDTCKKFIDRKITNYINSYEFENKINSLISKNINNTTTQYIIDALNDKEEIKKIVRNKIENKITRQLNKLLKEE
jgi:uncharacterized membrane-anchored protein YjiN (DUF445 family)